MLHADSIHSFWTQIRLQSIYLDAVARTKYVQRHGLNKLLSNFVKTVLDLRTTGITMNICGSNQLLKGALLFSVCNHLAAAVLGGFKEGCSFAKYPCIPVLHIKKHSDSILKVHLNQGLWRDIWNNPGWLKTQL